MDRDETTGAQKIDAPGRRHHERASGRRRIRHEVAVVQAEIRRMHRRSIGDRPPGPPASSETARI
ncbi:MAG TPA: hypothetical protein VFN55_00815 [Solirubrobacteraceae bacterium]|nr:hypothetical protein [Solirubrobacteraceae bacterium]